jgi:hypothetical protein
MLVVLGDIDRQEGPGASEIERDVKDEAGEQRARKRERQEESARGNLGTLADRFFAVYMCAL